MAISGGLVLDLMVTMVFRSFVVLVFHIKGGLHNPKSLGQPKICIQDQKVVIQLSRANWTTLLVNHGGDVEFGAKDMQVDDIKDMM